MDDNGIFVKIMGYVCMLKTIFYFLRIKYTIISYFYNIKNQNKFKMFFNFKKLFQKILSNKIFYDFIDFVAFHLFMITTYFSQVYYFALAHNFLFTLQGFFLNIIKKIII